MKTKSLAKWPSIVSENSLTAYSSASSSRSTKQQGVVKLLPPVPVPDEMTISKLNELAAKGPFCRYMKVKQHETL